MFSLDTSYIYTVSNANRLIIKPEPLHQVTYGAPVADDEDAEIELEDGGEEGKGHSPRPDGEEVPQHLGDDGLVGHGQLVVAGVPQNLLVGGDHPGQRDQGGRGRETWRDRRREREKTIRGCEGRDTKRKTLAKERNK